MAEGGWEQKRLDLEQWQQPSIAILLALGGGGEGARVWLNEASVLSRSGCPGQGLSWETPPTPHHCPDPALTSLVLVLQLSLTGLSYHWMLDGGLCC